MKTINNQFIWVKTNRNENKLYATGCVGIGHDNEFEMPKYIGKIYYSPEDEVWMFEKSIFMQIGEKTIEEISRKIKSLKGEK